MLSANISKSIIFISLFSFFIAAQECLAYNITILQTSKAAAYQQSLEGFLSVAEKPMFKRGQKSIQPTTINVIDLTLPTKGNNLKEKILADNPDLVVTIGRKALLNAIDLPRSLPVIYLLAPDGDLISQGQANISGVKMDILPARQLAGFKEVLPSIKKLGVIYDPKNSKDIIAEARTIAKMHGITLITEEATSNKQILGILAGMAHRVDSFWMLPDSTVVTPATIDALLLFSFENHIPLLTFANKYLKLGATISASFDLFDMGVQAGRMAQKVLASPNANVALNENPEKVVMKLNHKMAAKLGVYVNTASLSTD